MDITQYQQNRQNAIENVEQPHRFKWELQCYLENEAEKEAPHLKNAIEVLAHLIQSDMNDVELLRKTLYTYGSLPGVTEKAKRSIGNLTMSSIHSVNMADVALQVNANWKILLNLKMNFFYYHFLLTQNLSILPLYSSTMMANCMITLSVSRVPYCVWICCTKTENTMKLCKLIQRNEKKYGQSERISPNSLMP